LNTIIDSMASTKPEKTVVKPVTRKETDVWLVGQLSSTLSDTKLPSKKEVMALFFHYKQDMQKTVRDASHCTAEDVLKVWAKATIPTRLKKHVVNKVEDLFREWEKLRKNKENKAKRSESLQQKEKNWKEGLEDLFDIAHADALELMTIQEDKDFLIAQREKGRRGQMGAVDTALHKRQIESLKRKEAFERRKAREEADKISREEQVILTSSSSEAEEEMPANVDDHALGAVGDAPSTSQPTPRKRGRLNLFDDKLAASLDVAKLSDRGAAVVITPVLQNLGHNPAEYKVSYATIRRERMKYRKAIAEGLKAEFRSEVPLTIHWDGKLLPDITGKETVDRLPILVSGNGVDQLLAVPKLPSGSGEASATAVYEAALAWGLCDKINAMSFDTTAVNTGRLNGACVLLEQKMEKELLWLACRHHMLEIMLEAVVMHCLGPSKSPDIAIFKRFQAHWPYINQSAYQTALSDEQTARAVADVGRQVTAFAENQLEKFQPRADYRELLELTIVFLGGVPRKGISFKSPAGLHRARWMAKAIYSLKIWMFQGQFKLTTRETKGLQKICLFAVQLYVEAWFTAPSACSAPRQDLQLLKAIHKYADADISQVAMKKFLGHLWYLSEELVALAFFDDSLSTDAKQKMVNSLKKPGIENPPKRATVDLQTVESKELEDFVSANTTRFFELTRLPFDFLSKDPSQWEQDDTYKSVRATVCNMRVVNDIAERGVALMDEYNLLHTNDEEQKQFLLLAVKNYRQQYPDRNKSTLMQ